MSFVEGDKVHLKDQGSAVITGVSDGFSSHANLRGASKDAAGPDTSTPVKIYSITMDGTGVIKDNISAEFLEAISDGGKSIRRHRQKTHRRKRIRKSKRRKSKKSRKHKKRKSKQRKSKRRTRRH